MGDLVRKLRYDPNGRTLMPAELRWRCEEAADALEAQAKEIAELRAALAACRNYIVSPLRMSSDEDERKRRDNVIENATNALAATSKAVG